MPARHHRYNPSKTTTCRFSWCPLLRFLITAAFTLRVRIMLAAFVACVGAEESLETIFEQYGTDKQADFHGYVHAYSMLLGPWRHHVQSLLEVGIGTVNHSFAANMGTKRNYSTGASLYSWRRYLPNARIVGLDLDAAAAAAAADKSLRIEAYGVDTTSGPALAALDLTNGGRSLFDVVIDDGLHTWKGQQQTLTNLWPLVRPGASISLRTLCGAT